MKRIFVILFAMLPMLMNAGVIMKKSGERIEDVSIKSASGSDVVYLTTSGKEVTLSKSEVSAILYDDGRYEEIRQENMSSSTSKNENSVVQNPSNQYTPAKDNENSNAYDNNAILVHYKSIAERRKNGRVKEFSYGTLEMDEAEMLVFVGERCPEAYAKLLKAKDLKISGWSVLGSSGAFCVPVYVPLLAVGYVQYDKAIDYFNKNCSH